MAAQAKALVEARYVMAERHPRDLDVVRERLLKECRRPGFAEAARYRKPIGRGVEGPSIRFAEAAIRIMGNFSVDQMTVYDDHEKRIVRVTVVDCETNTPYASDITIEKTVERSSTKDGDEVLGSRLNSRGKMVYRISATEDDLLNKQNAQISKAIRNNGLRLVPADIVDECMDEAIRTMQATNAKDPDAARRKLFDAFGSVGVPVDQLKALMGHDCATLTPAELTSLRGLYSAIRDGETTWREIVEANTPSRGPDDKTAQAKTTTDAIKERFASKSEEKRIRSMTTGTTQAKQEAHDEQLSSKKAAEDVAPFLTDQQVDEIWPKPPEGE